jgi:hypothetical protein
VDENSPELIHIIGAADSHSTASCYEKNNLAFGDSYSVFLITGCGAMAIGRTDNMYQLWGILILAGLGIGGIVLAKANVSRQIPSHKARQLTSGQMIVVIIEAGTTIPPILNCHYFCAHPLYSRGRRWYRLHHLLQCLHLEVCPSGNTIVAIKS